jgi:hypothetical protein
MASAEPHSGSARRRPGDRPEGLDARGVVAGRLDVDQGEHPRARSRWSERSVARAAWSSGISAAGRSGAWRAGGGDSGYLEHHNTSPEPFEWIADADLILDRIKRVIERTSDSGH